MHNAVIRPHMGGLNPYHLGFVIFQDIKERFGLEECFIARESCNDIAFIRQYLTHELCQELNLFSWSEKKEAYTIDEISDEDGWKKVRTDMCNSIADSKLPVIKVSDVMIDGTLVLEHEHDGRDLELDYADHTVEHAKILWGNNVILNTIIEGDLWEI